MSNSYAASISTHPDAATAVGEIAGDLLERLGTNPDVVVAFVSTHHGGNAGLIARSLRTLCGAGELVGTCTDGVMVARRGTDDGPAIAAWAAVTGAATPVRITASREDATGSGQRFSEVVIRGIDADQFDGAAALVLMVDPYSVPTEGLLDEIAKRHPHLKVVGGIGSGGPGPGSAQMFAFDELHRGGAVGLLLGHNGEALHVPSNVPAAATAQGAEPLGQAMTVTGSEGGAIVELAGEKATRRLDDVIAAEVGRTESMIGPDAVGEGTDGRAGLERSLMSSLKLGVVVDEHQTRFTRGDFLIKPIRGIDRISGSIDVGRPVDIGTTVQFHRGDAEAADAELWATLVGATAVSSPRSALVFAARTRATRLFGDPDHDIAAVSDRLGCDAVAGMFCAGEIGPAGGRPQLHDGSAVVLLLS